MVSGDFLFRDFVSRDAGSGMEVVVKNAEGFEVLSHPLGMTRRAGQSFTSRRGIGRRKAGPLESWQVMRAGMIMTSALIFGLLSL